MDEVTLDEVNAAVPAAPAAGRHARGHRHARCRRDARRAGGRPAEPDHLPEPKPDAIVAEDREIAAFPLHIRAADVTIVKVRGSFHALRTAVPLPGRKNTFRSRVGHSESLALT